MFSMPGLPKILVLVIIIVVIWQAFKIIGRVQKARIAEAQARVREAKAQARNPRQTRTQAATTRTGVAETRECPVCGAYVAQGSGACGKPRCPFGS
jgi:type II secretory pathway component PulM